MLIWFVVLYLTVSIGIGLYAATRVHTAKDFAVAGRHLPLPAGFASGSFSALAAAGGAAGLAVACATAP